MTTLDIKTLNAFSPQDAIKFEVLTLNKFFNISTLTSGSYTACLELSDLASVGLLATLGYSMTATIRLSDGSFQISFKDTITV